MNSQFLQGAILSGIVALIAILVFLWYLNRKLQQKMESGSFFMTKDNVFYRCITAPELNNMLIAERKRARNLTLNGHQLYEALQLVMPDIGESMQLQSELTIYYGHGKIDDQGNMGIGLFAYPTEYPDEGVYHLEEDPTPLQVAEYARLKTMTPARNPMTTLAVDAPVEGEEVNADVEGAAIIASASLSARRKALQEAARVVRTDVDQGGGDLADGGYTIEAIETMLDRRAKQIEELGA